MITVASRKAVLQSGKTYATMSKVVMGNGRFTVSRVNLKVFNFSVLEGNSTNTCIHAFSYLVAKSP